MSLIGQAARDEFKDRIVQLIDKRIERFKANCGYGIITYASIQEELENLKKEIQSLDAE